MGMDLVEAHAVISCSLASGTAFDVSDGAKTARRTTGTCCDVRLQ
jgi:hypothetical protein